MDTTQTTARTRAGDMISLKMPPELAIALKEAALMREMSRSGLIRLVMTQWLAANTQDDKEN